MEHERITIWNDDIVLPTELVKDTCALIDRVCNRMEALAQDEQDWEAIRELDENKYILGKRCEEREAAR